MRLDEGLVISYPASYGSLVFDHDVIAVFECIAKVKDKLLSFDRRDVQIVIINQFTDEF